MSRTPKVKRPGYDDGQDWGSHRILRRKRTSAASSLKTGHPRMSLNSVSSAIRAASTGA